MLERKRESRDREHCLCVTRRPNYIDRGREKERMAVCLFFDGMGERPIDMDRVERSVCSERERGGGRGRRGPRY